MEIISRKANFLILRLNTGEEFILALKKLAQNLKIKGAWFWAIGAADKIEIAFYDLKKKSYIQRKFSGRLEILNITGNIAIKNGGVIIHAHGVFGTPRFDAIGGHIISCRISATCEIYLLKTSLLRRTNDPKSGLNVLANL
jgi:predicted DNA-binding protein with PD1-like motif